jgi:hypothetical protein
MIKDLEKELYILFNTIEYYGYNYDDYQQYINDLEKKIDILNKLEKF